MAKDRDHPIASDYRNLRKEAKLTQEDLEAKTGICKKKISAIENGDMYFIRNFLFEEMEGWKIVCREAMITNGKNGLPEKWSSRSISYLLKMVT